MKACQEFIKSKEPKIRASFKVSSKSQPNEFHVVELLENGELLCDCVAGLFKRFCSHKQKVAEELTKKGIYFVNK